MRKEKRWQKVMKTFVKTIAIGNYYTYCVYKITDSVGRTYYVAEPILHGVTRTAEDEETLTQILNRDLNQINQFQQRVR